MLKTAKRWAFFSLIVCVIGLIICGAAVYIVDPFEIYRESSILPLYDQESYNNPGIVKNYAYDAVILGTSMVEMSNPSVIDECFGVSSVKLPMRGSHTAQMGWQLSHVLKYKPDLKLAILAVDAYSLVGDPDDRTEIVDYLWNDNLLDDVKYLLNFDVLTVRVPKVLKNIGKPLDSKRDDMYKWTDVEFTAQKVFDTVAWNANAEMKPADYMIEKSTENIEKNLEAIIRIRRSRSTCRLIPPDTGIMSGRSACLSSSSETARWCARCFLSIRMWKSTIIPRASIGSLSSMSILTIRTTARSSATWSCARWPRGKTA